MLASRSTLLVVVIWPLLLSLLLTQADADAGSQPLRLRFEGNLVLPDEVYRNALQLPADARPDEAPGAEIARQVQQFLLSTGYELADVYVTIDADGLTAHIDEGQLERVVYRGRLTVRMLRFMLALNLPSEVFNRPHLEREVAEHAKEIGIEPPAWNVVEATSPWHPGEQLHPTPSLQLGGRPLIRPGHRHELQFAFGPMEWNTGVGLSVRTSWLNGLELGVNTQGTSLALRDDRWRVAISGGVALRTDIPRNHIYVFPSRLRAEALWYAPPLEPNTDSRPFVLAFGEWLLRQRRDLGLENYMAVRTELSANFGLRLHPMLTAQAGVGLQYFWLGNFQPAEGQPAPPVGTDWRFRTFGEARIELTFADGGARPDRRHALAFRGRVSGNLTRFDLPAFFESRLDYQLVIPFGWHDLWFRVRGTWMSGDVLFPFEEAMGQHLPAVFRDVWLRKAAGLRVEYRHSLVRDVAKVGVFAKGLVWGDEQRETSLAIPRFGLGAGPSAHLLFFGLFQIDLFLDFAVLSDGRTALGLQLWVNKVF